MTSGATETAILDRWSGFLRHCRERIEDTVPLSVSGRLTRVAGLVMEAVGVQVPVGGVCVVYLPDGHRIDAEVVGFAGDKLFLMPSTDVFGLVPGARVVPVEPAVQPLPRLRDDMTVLRRGVDRFRQVSVGDGLLGRVLDGDGRPLDHLGPVHCTARAPLYTRPINPLQRAPIRQTLDVGVRAINALLAVGRGQRLGLFAGSGIGKSVLLGMMARYTSADVVVVGLIGERGREVKDFIENNLGAEGLRRSVVVAAPADTPPLMRLHSAAYATAIAEYFRDRGKNVLLLMDSLTRYAMAQREIALAIGEPPATKGYPPSVFAKLPALVERAGNVQEGGGSITAFYTVLVEGDDQQDPVADAARAILDGHVVLSRALADQGHYPPIDIEMSVSRAITDLLAANELQVVRRFKYLYTRYQRNRDLISVGAYVRGNDAVLDEAIALFPEMEKFLCQDMHQRVAIPESRAQLEALLAK